MDNQDSPVNKVHQVIVEQQVQQVPQVDQEIEETEDWKVSDYINTIHVTTSYYGNYDENYEYNTKDRQYVLRTNLR